MTVAARSSSAPGYGWLLGMSAWLVLPLFGPGVAWVGFLVTGAVARRTAVIITGVVLAVLGITLGIELWGDLSDLVNAVVHLGGIVAGLAVNPGWLRTMWDRRSRGENLLAPSAAAAPTPARPASQPKRQSRSRRSAAKQRGNGARTGGRKAASSGARPAADGTSDDARRLATQLGAGSSDLLQTADPAAPVDVQTASADELLDLPGMNRTRARRVVKERTKRNGFASLEDFGEAAGLQPHEIVRLRAVATCSARPRGERRFGRRVDY